MVSLWGSKNGEERDHGDDAEDDGGDGGHQPRHSGGREPDERTRLLPPRNDGFLDPDDPAVSFSNAFHTSLLTSDRYLPTIYGASELSDTFVFSSLSLVSYGGYYFWYPYSSARQ